MAHPLCKDLLVSSEERWPSWSQRLRTVIRSLQAFADATVNKNPKLNKGLYPCVVVMGVGPASSRPCLAFEASGKQMSMGVSKVSKDWEDAAPRNRQTELFRQLNVYALMEADLIP